MGNFQDGYKTLKVYEKANELVIIIYEITKNFPKEELFGLTSQIRRAVVSVVANVVEGWARKSKADKLRFYYIARGSLYEVRYYIDLSFQLKFINGNIYKSLFDLSTEVIRLLKSFINSVEKK